MTSRPRQDLRARLARAGRGWQWATVFALAWLWRRLLFRTRFVAVTGSLGKTTCKELLAEALAETGPTARSSRNQNDAWGVPRSLLRVRPWHRFAVIETGAGIAGELGRSARLLRPHVAVVTCVEEVHVDRFPTLEAVAREKSALVRSLARGGTAVLHADDPHVAGMAALGPFGVRTFGVSAGRDVRAVDVGAAWPERLCFRAIEPGGAFEVRTRLVGSHWLPSVLGAWTAARACGAEPEQILAAFARTPPTPARLDPVVLPSGAQLLRDESGGNKESFARALDVLHDARAERRWVVASDLADSADRTRRRLRKLGRAVAEVTDFVVFVGLHARHGAAGARAGGLAAERVHQFERLEDASAFLAEAVGPGDLVLLKGRSSDHLSRLVLAQQGPVSCWRSYCPKRTLCDDCPELRA